MDVGASSPAEAEEQVSKTHAGQCSNGCDDEDDMMKKGMVTLTGSSDDYEIHEERDRLVPGSDTRKVDTSSIENDEKHQTTITESPNDYVDDDHAYDVEEEEEEKKTKEGKMSSKINKSEDIMDDDVPEQHHRNDGTDDDDDDDGHDSSTPPPTRLNRTQPAVFTRAGAYEVGQGGLVVARLRANLTSQPLRSVSTGGVSSVADSSSNAPSEWRSHDSTSNQMFGANRTTGQPNNHYHDSQSHSSRQPQQQYPIVVIDGELHQEQQSSVMPLYNIDRDHDVPHHNDGLFSSSTEFKPITQWMYKKRFVILVGLVMVAVAIGVAVPLTTTSSSNTSSNTSNNNNNDAAFQQRQALVLSHLSDTISSSQSLQDVTTPQYMALQWIVRNDTMSPVDDFVMNTTVAKQQIQQLVTRYVLAVFYFSLGGPSWYYQNFWLDGYELECNWQHVICGSTSWNNNPNHTIMTIQGINATSNGLVGYVTSELQHLSSLRVLWLLDNQITGVAPELGNLSELTKLSLEANKIGGSISSWIFELTALQELRISANRFNGTIPTALSKLSTLNALTVDQNFLSGIVGSQFRSLSSLQTLFLGQNSFKSSLNDLFQNLNHESLISVDVGQNGFVGTLGVIAAFTNLKNVVLGLNLLTGTIPTEFGLLKDIETLVMNDNRLNGSIPSELADLSHLSLLKLDGNKALTGIVPTSLCSLSNLALISVDCQNCTCKACHKTCVRRMYALR